MSSCFKHCVALCFKTFSIESAVGWLCLFAAVATWVVLTFATDEGRKYGDGTWKIDTMFIVEVAVSSVLLVGAAYFLCVLPKRPKLAPGDLHRIIILFSNCL